MKTCSRCQETKELTEFGKKTHNSDGLQGTCKPCQLHYSRQANAAKREANEAKARESYELRANEKKPCSKCGEVKPLTEFGRQPGCRDGLKTYCKLCRASQGKAWRAVSKEYCAAKTKAWRLGNPVPYMIQGAKTRAKKVGVPFNLEAIDVTIPDVCPVLGIPLVKGVGGHSPNSPSLDRIVPELGYVKGNVAVISNRANTIKNDANPEEILAVYNWLTSVLPKAS